MESRADAVSASEVDGWVGRSIVVSTTDAVSASDVDSYFINYYIRKHTSYKNIYV